MKHRISCPTLILLAAILVGVSASEINASQNARRYSTPGRKSRIQLRNVNHFKEAFQNDTGKVRLVALISPT
jgi:hypothetical protein